MAHYFFDTSALVKRHVIEAGSPWVKSLCPRRRLTRSISPASPPLRSRRRSPAANAPAACRPRKEEPSSVISAAISPSVTSSWRSQRRSWPPVCFSRGCAACALRCRAARRGARSPPRPRERRHRGDHARVGRPGAQRRRVGRGAHRRRPQHPWLTKWTRVHRAWCLSHLPDLTTQVTQGLGIQNAGIQEDGIRCHASVIRVELLSKVCELGKNRFAAFVRVTLVVKHIP